MREYLVVGLGLAQRLDALLLQHDHPVVGLGAGVRDVARAVGELADVPALEVGAGRQDDIGEASFTLEPDGLVDDHAHFAFAVGLHVAVGLGHGADERGAVLPVHLDVRVAGRRIVVLLELRLDGRAAETLAVPLDLLVHHGFGDADARDRLALGGVMRGAGGALRVGEHAIDHLDSRRPSCPRRRRCRPRRSPGRRTTRRSARPGRCPRCCCPACRSPAWPPGRS